MKKLSEERLQELVNERNEKGFAHTVEVMNAEELAAYKNNCLEAIERLEAGKKKYKAGGQRQAIKNEIIEELDGYIAYIDNILSKEEVVTGEEAIELFLNNWIDKSVAAHLALKEEHKAIKDRKEKLKFLSGLTKSDALILTSGVTEKGLREMFTKEAAQKKAKFISGIEKKAGKILDVSGLHIHKMEINGQVIGENGIVSVTTVMAGGYNIQSTHYRTLIKLVK